MVTESKIAHLQMIQGVISRLATNSFLVKGWSVTLVSALFALAAAETSRVFVYLTYFPAFAFWALDAYFLRQEKLFRKLHDDVRAKTGETDFLMETAAFESQVPRGLRIAFSETLRLFHGTIVGAIVVVMVLLGCGDD